MSILRVSIVIIYFILFTCETLCSCSSKLLLGLKTKAKNFVEKPDDDDELSLKNHDCCFPKVICGYFQRFHVESKISTERLTRMWREEPKKAYIGWPGER